MTSLTYTGSSVHILRHFLVCRGSEVRMMGDFQRTQTAKTGQNFRAPAARNRKFCGLRAGQKCESGNITARLSECSAVRLQVFWWVLAAVLAGDLVYDEPGWPPDSDLRPRGTGVGYTANDV